MAITNHSENTFDSIEGQTKVNKAPGVKGSKFVLNNTSYSGVDIKVVVNIYNAGGIFKEEIKDLEENILFMEKNLKLDKAKLSKNIKTISGLKAGTNKRANLESENLGLRINIATFEKFLPDAREKIKKLRDTNAKVTTKVLAETQTLSVQTFRDKQAVRACGSVYPKGFTRGPRQIAGSMIFTVFHEHVLYRFLEAHASDFDATAFTSALMDQLPPVDIVIAFANEYGSTSRMTIYGVEFINDGQVMSIEDIMTEQTVSFVARDIDPMRSVSQRKLDENSILTTQWQPKRASDLLLEDDYQDLKAKISPFSRFKRRRNPFL